MLESSLILLSDLIAAKLHGCEGRKRRSKSIAGTSFQWAGTLPSEIRQETLSPLLYILLAPMPSKQLHYEVLAGDSETSKTNPMAQ